MLKFNSERVLGLITRNILRVSYPKLTKLSFLTPYKSLKNDQRQGRIYDFLERGADFFLADQFDFSSSPKALKKLCFG